MNEFLDALFANLQVILDDPLLGNLIRISIALIPISLMFCMIDFLMGVSSFGFFDLVASFFEWLGGKIVTLMCRSQRGFELAYKLGWARPGIDFFDCGQDCDKCPRYAECDNDLRVPFEDVTQNSDPGAGS